MGVGWVGGCAEIWEPGRLTGQEGKVMMLHEGSNICDEKGIWRVCSCWLQLATPRRRGCYHERKDTGANGLGL